MTLVEQGRSLTELSGIGPHLQRIIRAWIENPPQPRKPDPLRANFLTLVDARAVLARQPEWARRLRGDLQMHTQYSDGSGTVQAMADEGEKRGYEFIAVTDHSKGLSIANGMDEQRLRRQGEEIQQVNAALAKRGAKVRVLKAIEMNLNPQGDGDMESQALTELDLVLGSFHSALRKKEDQTARYLAGLRNPDIQVLGHPRGRVYNYRAGLSADWPRVFAEAAALDKAVEIDCYVDRQDLSIELLPMARDAGVRISIGTDAHSPDQLGFIELGLATALLAKIPVERILNFMQREELLAWATKLKSNRGRSLRRSKLQLRQGELISAQGVNMAGTDKRFVRRAKEGTFKESDDVGKSLAADRRTKAKMRAKPGQGDKGDRKVASKKKK
jgi:histidinol phosphatase-like PHP family hydrolase